MRPVKTASLKSKGPTPESAAKCGLEHGHQVALFMWAALNRPERPDLESLFAIPNGGERNIIVASNLKAEGVKDGVPDIFLAVARGPWHGLFIELKRPGSAGKDKGRVKPEQAVWIERLKRNGYGAMVCVGWEEARDTIINYLDWRS
jgi:hypothetical protein